MIIFHVHELFTSKFPLSFKFPHPLSFKFPYYFFLCKMNNWCLIYGCMRAGKTTKLQSYIENCKQNYMVVNNLKDNRYGIGDITTHNLKKINSYACDNIETFKYLVQSENPQSIFIDEIHFFTKTFITDLIREFSNYKIYFSGLDKDYNGVHFESTALLMNVVPLHNQIHEKALCECGQLAEYSKIQGLKPESGNISVGNHYKSVCTKCFYGF